MSGQISFYRKRIRSVMDTADKSLYSVGVVSRSIVEPLIDLIEAFVILSNVSGDRDLILEANAYENRLRCYTFGWEAINEGFENPFSEYDQSVASYANVYQDELYGGSHKSDEADNIKIHKIRLWDNDTANKVMFKGGKMISGQYFGRGDIIECCPMRVLFEKDMYSENIRDFAFTLDKQKGVYAIPFGYASFYRNSKDSGLSGNCDYEFVIGNNPNESYIKIFAIKPIKKGTEIILHSDDTDFENEIKPGQFKYDNDDKYVSVKNFKIL